MIKSCSPLEKIERIAVTTGPGGFMSLRVGLSIANALSWSLKIPIAGTHLADVWRSRVKGKDVLWLHSTKKEFLFVCGLGKFAKQWPDPVLLSLADTKMSLDKGVSFVGELIPEQLDILKLTPFEEVDSIEKVLPQILENLSYGTSPLLPWYGRGA